MALGNSRTFLTKASNGLITLMNGLQTSAGVADASKLIATNSAGKLDSSLLPTGVELIVENMVSFEDLVAGDFVNIYDSGGGTRKARKAAASSDKPADGFVLTAVTAPATVNVYLRGLNNALTGLTVGAIYYLSATSAGEATATAVAETSGNIHQMLGKAMSATSILFEYDAPIYF